MTACTFRQPVTQREDWYAGRPVLVPAVELDEGRAVVYPYCHEGVHVHGGPDGIHAPACNRPRAQYLVRALPPAAYVRLLLNRLGFQAEQVQQIMDEIAYAPRA